MSDKVYIKVFRGETGNQHWETFDLNVVPGMNVIAALMEIRKNPVTIDGKVSTPVVWESGCLEEVCGACSMLINGYPRQACTALLLPIMQQTKSSTITLAPLTKFPLIRDLVVDRSSMFENLKRIKAWVEVDGYYDAGTGPVVSKDQQEVMYVLSTCMSCGCCSEACPQVNSRSSFIGPAPISQVRLFSIHPTARLLHQDRMRALLAEGGIANCGNAQNCVRVCPKKIPLTDSIAFAGRQATRQAIHDIFGAPERPL
jgi:succinate dehydrogenase / fumarate reductase iron-sulfur subunit